MGERMSWRERAAPTWLIAAVMYTGYALVTWFFHDLSWWQVLPVGAVLIAWHGSLQHEAVHGQLAPDRRLNDLIVYPPLAIWLPYPIYRRTHRAHHNFEILTDPHRDPESFYLDRARWQRCGPAERALYTFHNTLIGRLLLGPFLVIGQFWLAEARALVRGDHGNLAAWLWHVPSVALVLLWVVLVCGIPLWAYVLLFVLPGTSLTLLRSFAEHAAAEDPQERTAVVEAGPFFGLLFLNNNLHYAHHKRPDLPWHRLPEYYRRNRDQLLRENGGLLYNGYQDIAIRYGTRPIASPEHPFV